MKQRSCAGGANVPALNDLLASWGIAFSSEVVEGETMVNDHKLHYASGTAIARFPEDGSLLARDLNHQGTYSIYTCTCPFFLCVLHITFLCIYTCTCEIHCQSSVNTF